MEERVYIRRDKGKGFRSMGETQVARLLDRVGVAYLYEHPLAVADEGKVRIWYPDFQLPGYGILIEYFGMKDRPDYEAGIRKKQAVYESNGLTALALRPESFSGNWPERVLSEIERILEERMRDFREKRDMMQAKRRLRQREGSR
jgi:hypothetical protein